MAHKLDTLLAARPIDYMNLYESTQRLGLTLDGIVPLHGRMVGLTEMRKAIGKAS